jgi:basic membrane protein A
MKNNLKVATLILAAVTLAACGQNKKENYKFKAGLITLHDDKSTYDANFINGFKAACAKMNVEPVISTGIPEGTEAKDEAIDLAENGCKFVFADSFGHEDYMIKAAKEFKDVQFSHGTGTKAHTENLSNYHNAFASIYEGRYIAGVAAGLKLKSMIEANPNTSHKLGYVGAYTYAEVISGYTAYYLGAKSIVDDVTMEVQFTGSWYDEASEKDAAKKLIANGCSVISQHADSWGAPNACEEAGVPNITYNGSTESNCPNTYVISSKINWQPYFEDCFDKILNGGTIATDYTGSLGDTLYVGSVVNTTLGAKAAVSGTEAKLNEVHAALKNGTLKVFDTSKFTVDGKTVTSYLADVNTDAEFKGDTEVIKTVNGVSYFAESEFRSAPYFDLKIDGISLLNTKF